MKRIVITLLVLFLLKTVSYSQEKLPVQDFNFTAAFEHPTPLRFKLKDKYTFFKDSTLNTASKYKTSKGIEVYLIDYLEVSSFDLSPMEVLKFQFQSFAKVKIEGNVFYFNPYENKSISTIDPSLQDWISAKTHYNFEQARLQRKQKLANKYGADIGEKLYNLDFDSQMTKEMIEDALGRPDKVNTTQSQNSKDEQVIYRNYYNLNSKYGYAIMGGPLYFYFTDGQLTTVQN